MKTVKVLLGPSGCGKDYIARTIFPNLPNIKINQAFKNCFEQDHNLYVGACNNKEARNWVLETGPYAGMTIQDGMVRAYNESLEPNVPSYGAQFAGRTLLSGVEKLLDYNCTCVITDLRKKSEAIVLKEFAVNQLGMHWQVFWIYSNHSKPQPSDNEIIAIRGMGPYQVICNVY